MNYWTIEDDTRLIEYHSQGMVYSAIGRLLGRSKNSCISRSRILKLTPRPTPKHPEPLDRRVTNQSVVTQKSSHSVPLPEWGHKGGITIFELKENTCRFPTEKNLYCGAPVSHKVYCACHAAICFVKEKKR